MVEARLLSNQPRTTRMLSCPAPAVALFRGLYSFFSPFSWMLLVFVHERITLLPQTSLFAYHRTILTPHLINVCFINVPDTTSRRLRYPNDWIIATRYHCFEATLTTLTYAKLLVSEMETPAKYRKNINCKFPPLILKKLS